MHRARPLGVWLTQLDASHDADTRSLATDLRAALLPELETLRFELFALWLERTRRHSFYL